MAEFSAIEIALGRYLVYGLVSCLLFCKIRQRYPVAIWKQALLFSLLFSIGYYTFVVLALRYATPAICALILGISPITIAFYGNWKQRECSFRSLLLPSLLILVGLVIINAPHLQGSATPSTYLLGLMCAFWALLSWSWYVVANSRFLKDHPEVRSNDWSTLLGVTTLFWVIALGAGIALFSSEQIDMHKYANSNFFLGSTVLGLLCSWVGAFLWNRASFHLPVSLAGQLTIFETLFGILFVYAIKGHMPPILECVGMLFFLAAITFGIRQFAIERV